MLRLSLFILGFTSLIGQVMITRELMVSFYGNEFFIGWILFGWFIWVAVGSLGTKLFRRQSRETSFLIACHLFVTLLLPLEIFLIRLSKNLFLTAPGQIPDIIPAMASSFFILAPLCLVLGLQFTFAFECWKKGVGEAYFWEALGFVVGGAAFNYKLVFLNEFQISAILAGLNLAPAFALWCDSLRSLTIKNSYLKKGLLLATAMLAVLTVLCLKNAGPFNFQTASLRFPNEKLLETKNSIYGNLAVTWVRGQYNFYHNGLPAGTSRDEAFNECLVHLPMLSHPNPQKVLLVGTGFNGALDEILKYDPQQIFYAEINPDMIDLAYKYVPSQVFHDKRVYLLKGDLRIFFKNLPKDFDVIMINLPNPSTAMINRYFTDDFFKQARGHLKSDGILSTHIAFSSDFVPRPLEDLGTSIYRTMKGQFSSLVILPEDNLFFIASQTPLVKNPQELIQRMEARNIHNYFVTAPYLTYRYTTDRIKMVTDIFEANTSAGKNFDLYPKGYYYNLIHWLSVFHQGLAGIFQAVGKINDLFVFFIGILLAALPFLLKSTFPQRLIAAMATGGFSLMSAEMLVIYGFQVFYGNLYYKIATIICAVMAGMVLGSWAGNKIRAISKAGVVWIHLLTGLYFILWLTLLRMAYVNQWPLMQGEWILLALSIGLMVGFEFSYVSRLMVAPGASDSHQAVIIYAADLIGSCLGVLATSLFLLPIYGVYKTLLFLVFVNATVAAGFLIHSKAQA